MKIKRGLVIFVIAMTMILAACSSNNNSNNNDEAATSIEVKEVVGIEPGSGTMTIAQETIDEYGLDLKLTASSEPAMLTELESAISKEEPIVVTLWQPHWMFTKHDLKFLEDPKKTLGEAENIHTMVRKGLADDKPEAHTLLDNFYWEVEDMNDVMSQFAEDDDVEPRDAANNWIEENPDKVAAWTEGIEQVDGEEIELAYVNWDTELSSTNVVALVLEDLGYDVTLTALDMGIAFESLSLGDVDGMLIAWLPIGAASYKEQYDDKIDDLGPNLEGAQQGFVVPAYMDIDSIEELPMK